jgi:transcriptional regulator with XRE-family HTH domain
MNLAELHQRLSQKPTYRKAYGAIGDVVLIGAAVRKLREDEGMTQQELVNQLGISQFYLSRLETGSGKVTPMVVATVVRHFEEPLRELGINVEPWLAMTPNTAPEEKPLSEQRPIMPESLSRSRRTTATEELPEGALRDAPVHKHGTHH